MFDVNYKNLEIAGFRGAVYTHCCVYEPIARDKTSGLYFEVSRARDEVEPKVVQTHADMEALKAGLFWTPFDAPPAAFERGGVVSVTKTFVEALGRRGPEDLADQFDWQPLVYDSSISALSKETVHDQIWVSYARRDAIERSMNGWASTLLKKSRDALVTFFQTDDEKVCAESELLAGLAMQAALDSSLVRRILIYYGAALTASETEYRLDGFYQRVVEPRTKCSWEDFKTRVSRLKDTLSIKAVPKGDERSDIVSLPQSIIQQIEQIEVCFSQTDGEGAWLRYLNDADAMGGNVALARRDRPPTEIVDSVEGIIRFVGNIDDKGGRYSICEQIAARFRIFWSFEKEDIAWLAKYIRSSSSKLPLNKDQLKILLCSPAFFYRRSFEPRSNLSPRLDVPELCEAVDEIGQEGLPLDELALAVSGAGNG